MKHLLRALILALAFNVGVAAQVTVPNTLVAGATIRASELNTNFDELGTKSLNRITGGQLEGNVIVLSNVTIDGVDISDFLTSTAVLTQVVGSAAAPSVSVVGDLDTGLYFPAVNELAVSLGGFQRLLLNASGLTIWGTNIINGTGKIPALTSTYIADLNGAALTNIVASTAGSFTGSLVGDVIGTQEATAINAGAIVNADINAAAGIVDTKLDTIVTAGKVANSATTGNTGAVANTLVLRTGTGGIAVVGLTADSATIGVLSASTSIATPAFRFGTVATAGHVLTTDALGNASWAASPSGTLGGSGTTGKIPKFSAGTTLADSIITEAGTVITVATGLRVGATFPTSSGVDSVGGVIVSSSQPVLEFYENDGALDTKFWRFHINSGVFALSRLSDDYGTINQTIFSSTSAGAVTFTTQVITPALQLTTGASSGYVLTSDGSGNASWAATNGVPTGAIFMMAGACPSGYTRFTALDDRFPRGNATYGATGGASSHDHTGVAGSTGNNGAHSHTQSGTFGSTTEAAHTHGTTTAGTASGAGPNAVVSVDSGGAHSHSTTISGATSSQADHSHSYTPDVQDSGNLPPYLNILFCQKS